MLSIAERRGLCTEVKGSHDSQRNTATTTAVLFGERDRSDQNLFLGPAAQGPVALIKSAMLSLLAHTELLLERGNFVLRSPNSFQRDMGSQLR